jgi:hypothetical protein
MNEFVSRRYSGWALLAALSVVFSILFIPNVSPWVGLAWVGGLALVVARGTGIRHGRSSYRVLHDVGAQPMVPARARASATASCCGRPGCASWPSR